MTEEKIQKIKEEYEGKLDIALQNLQSDDVSLRKKGVRHLSDRSRMALGDYKAKAVRNWFLREDIKLKMFEITEAEKDNTIKAEMLHTLYWVCDRHATFSLRLQDLPEDEVYLKSVRLFAEKFVFDSSADVLCGVGNLLAFFKDNRAWDIFGYVLTKKRDYLTIARFIYGYNDNEGKNNISNEQKQNLKKILKEISSKTKNAEIKSTVKKFK
ncbi:MAG: hypothetical protein E6767_09220 [Dysgonomonas sp.]|nr:hypothetical protein [Dysgonomonas sp.]